MAAPTRPTAYDVEIKLEDTASKNRLSTLLNPNKDTTLQIQTMDEEVGLMIMYFPILSFSSDADSDRTPRAIPA